MMYARYLVSSLFAAMLSFTVSAQQETEIEALKKQVRELTAVVDQLRSNQLVIARQLG